jgi:hypothetical protein
MNGRVALHLKTKKGHSGKCITVTGKVYTCNTPRIMRSLSQKIVKSVNYGMKGK